MWTHTCSTSSANSFKTKCERTQPRRQNRAKSQRIIQLTKYFRLFACVRYQEQLCWAASQIFICFMVLSWASLGLIIVDTNCKIIVNVKLFNNNHTTLLLKEHNWQKPLIAGNYNSVYTVKVWQAAYSELTIFQLSKDTRGRDWSLKHKYCQPVIRGHWWPARDAATLTSPRAVCVCRRVSLSTTLLQASQSEHDLTFKLSECWTCIMHAVCAHYPQGRDLQFATRELWVYQSLLPATPRTYLHTGKHQCAESPNSQTEYGLHSEA